MMVEWWAVEKHRDLLRVFFCSFAFQSKARNEL